MRISLLKRIYLKNRVGYERVYTIIIFVIPKQFNNKMTLSKPKPTYKN